MMKLSPIILFVYNRPEHTRKTMEALMQNELASESILYVFADGAKENATPEQISKVQEVRDYIHTIKGFKDVIIEESPKNKGLANSVIAGVTKVVNEYGKVIVVEDDIVTHPYFLRYMNDCLEVYKDRQDIYMIGGFSVNIKFPWWYRKDIYATYRSCSWGWATWKDRWEKADWAMKDYDDFCNDERRIKKFNRGGNDMFPMLQAQMNGEIDSWAIRWDYCISSNNGICIRPVKTLCTNCGNDGSGVHCGIVTTVLNNDLYPLDAPYKFRMPRKIGISSVIAKRFKQLSSYEPTRWDYIVWKFKALNYHINKLLGLKK